MKKYIFAFIISTLSLLSFAQTSDSTSMPWTSAPGLTNTISAPSGSLCGSATQGSPISDGNWTPCQGHYPLASCPANYYLVWLGGPANYGWYYPVNFYACARY